MNNFFNKIGKFLDKIDDATVDMLLSSKPIKTIESSKWTKRARKFCGITINE